MFEFTISISTDGKLSGTTKTEKKVREYKGASANKHVKDYCVLDLETTGIFVGSADIIEISAIKVRDNHVVGEYSTLINPKCHIPSNATAVNHITDDMVKDAPLLDDVIDKFLDFVGDDIIVGYNNACFDMNLIYDSVYDIRQKYFTNDYLDVLHAVRRSLHELENAKLETASKYYGFDTVGEHRALKDCYLTKAVYDNLYEEFGDKAFNKYKTLKKFSNSSWRKATHYSAETVALQELQKLLKRILEDGRVTKDEVDSLHYWIEEHRDLSGNYPFDKAFCALDDVLEDGQITDEELRDLKITFAEIVDPVKSQGCQDEIDVLVNKHICLTGEFNYGSKNDVEKLIQDAGGIVDKSVKKATNYVVVGAQGSEAWKTENYGSKIQKAMECNKKGQGIKIVEEKDFIPAAQYLVEHPDECGCVEGKAFDYDWKTPVCIMLDAKVIEEELPENSLYLMENYSRDGKKITSYSVCIYEPDYPLPPNAKKDPTRNSIVLNIKDNGPKLELIIGKVQFGDIEVPAEADVKEIKSDEKNMHVFLPVDSYNLVNYIRKNTEYAYANYISKASSFGCCSQFNACSDAKKCVHANKLYSKACIYRGHLDAGRIFYGKNRNID